MSDVFASERQMAGWHVFACSRCVYLYCRIVESGSVHVSRVCVTTGPQRRHRRRPPPTAPRLSWARSFGGSERCATRPGCAATRGSPRWRPSRAAPKRCRSSAAGARTPRRQRPAPAYARAAVQSSVSAARSCRAAGGGQSRTRGTASRSPSGPLRRRSSAAGGSISTNVVQAALRRRAVLPNSSPRRTHAPASGSKHDRSCEHREA